jgi:hypothetical protein
VDVHGAVGNQGTDGSINQFMALENSPWFLHQDGKDAELRWSQDKLLPADLDLKPFWDENDFLLAADWERSRRVGFR